MDMHLQTLIFVMSHGQVLLGRKKRGFGAGKYNGYGGKLDDDETVLQCAQRELFEESNLDIDVADLTHLGYVQFTDRTGKIDRRVHIYVCDYSYTNGQEVETEEMAPRWFEIGSVPYEEMWKDAQLWMPLVFRGRCFEATFWLDEQNNIDKHEIIEK